MNFNGFRRRKRSAAEMLNDATEMLNDAEEMLK